MKTRSMTLKEETASSPSASPSNPPARLNEGREYSYRNWAPPLANAALAISLVASNALLSASQCGGVLENPLCYGTMALGTAVVITSSFLATDYFMSA